jgi:3-hydroxyisobutyrate dehydrogenase-like beta-hydroxyacid dehydrogenase
MTGLSVAVLGTGKMGTALALRLLDSGATVAVWNRTPERTADAVGAGARLASSVADAVAGAGVVLTSLADDAAVRAVVAGEGGVASCLGDAPLVETSTVAPATTREMAAAVGGRMVAAPVLGAPGAVQAGKARFLQAGPGELVEELEPLWEALAGWMTYAGEDPGAATTLKLVANYLLMSGLAALSEAVATAQSAGMGVEIVRGFLADLPLVAPALQNRVEDVLTGEHAGWFSTLLGAKDVRLIEQLAAAGGLTLPIAAAVRASYEHAATLGWADADIGAVVEPLRRSAGLARPPAPPAPAPGE